MMNVNMSIHKDHALRCALLLTLLAIFFPLAGWGVTKQNADDAYTKGNYQQAIADYKELLKRGSSASLYYNLGNAYYRSDSLTQAILAYERASLLSPGDDDIRFNLQFARSKTIDKITPQSEMFFVTWYRSLVNLAGVDRWATLSVVSLVLALLLLLAYLFAPHLGVRKVGFFGSIGFVVVFLLSNLFAYQQKQMMESHCGAIIVAPSVTVKKTPNANSADAFVLHEGTRVDITDNSMKEWSGVRLADGREGWLPTSQLEHI